MQEINVFINGGISVDKDPIAIHSGEPVVWHFHNCNTSTVAWGEVEFVQPMATLFKGRGGAPGGVPSLKRGTDVGKGHGCIMGTAPGLGVLPGGGDAKAFKYHVKAYDRNP